MRKLFYILMIGLLLTSCKKERTIHITAKNAATGEPYSGLKYQIIRQWSGPYEEKSKVVGSGELDTNGEVYFTKKLRKNDTYKITVEEPENTCYNKNVNLYMGDEKNFEAAFEFAECAYMQQNIQNVNCEGSSDVFIIRDRYTYTEWSGWSIDLQGCFTNVGGGYSAVPAGTRYFEWKVTRPSGVTTGVDTVELVAGQNSDLNIFY